MLQLTTHFMALVPFNFLLKISENGWFCYLFRGYRKRPVTWHRLTKPQKIVSWPSNYSLVCTSSSTSSQHILKSFLAFSVVFSQTSFSVIFFTRAISLHDMLILDGIFRTYVCRKVLAWIILFSWKQLLHNSLASQISL